MAKPLLLAVLAATFAVTIAAAPRCRGPRIGGWSPISDVDDPDVKKLGGWAVAQHARMAKVSLQFCRVTRGERQLVAGMKYSLIVEAVDAAGRTAPYLVKMFEQSWTNTRNLTSFKPAARCPPRREDLCSYS